MKKYFNILFVLVFILGSCSDKVEDGYIINKTPGELRNHIIIGSNEYEVENKIEDLQKGLRYISMQITDENHPLVVHVVELDRTESNLQLETLLNNTISERVSPTEMASKGGLSGKKVVVAVNGDFFDLSTGTPIGGLMANGLYARFPNANWNTVFGVNEDNVPFIDKIGIKGQAISVGVAGTKDVTKVNTGRSTNDLVLYNSLVGTSTGANPWGKELLVAPKSGNWETLESYKDVPCEVLSKGQYATMDKGQFILSGNGTSDGWIQKVVVGEELVVSLEAISLNAPTMELKAKNFIGCQGVILEGGAVKNPQEKDPVTAARHPRTGLGYSADKTKVFFIVVEGRSDESKGVTLKEFGNVFGYFGASEAVNLDGGGSSCMVINGKVVNTLSGGAERPVPNCFAIVE